MKRGIVILVLSGFISMPSIAGELEDIMACVDAAAETSGVTLEPRDAKWEPLFWSTNSGHIFKHQFMINWRPSAVG